MYNSISSPVYTKRKFPHLQIPGKSYFVTFSTKDFIILSKEARKLLYDVILFHNNKKYDLHAFVVMKDHVHIILNPLPKDDGLYSLTEIMHSIKSYSSNQINKLENQKGRILWLPESYDVVVRKPLDHKNILRYVVRNKFRDEDGLTFLQASLPVGTVGAKMTSLQVRELYSDTWQKRSSAEELNKKTPLLPSRQNRLPSLFTAKRKTK